MLDNKTIFAPSTHPGKAGVAIIRISGEDSFKALEIITNIKDPEPRKAIFSKITCPKTSDILDHAIILAFPAPNSFTGENIVELHTHGSVAVINAIIATLSEIENLRVALPGEFAKRSFMNGKMDLTQAEGLSDLIESETRLQQKQAMRQMSGDLYQLYNDWRSKILRSLAYLEAFLDFPDEELPEDLVTEINQLQSNLVAEISSHIADNERGEKLRSGLYVTIIGKPNVGKSSLLNYLAKRDVAIVSNIAGTTRDIIEVHLDINGYPITIADTAGIRESDNEIENLGIEKAISRSNNADFSIIMFDACSLDNNDIIKEKITNTEAIYIANKIDLQQSNNIINQENILNISIKENIGMDKLLEMIENFAKSIISPSSSPVITRTRYRYHLKECISHLQNFSIDNDLELAAEDLRMATSEIAKITGNIDVDDILDQIFGNFCIGK
jgi:tRNA modification GTPase